MSSALRVLCGDAEGLGRVPVVKDSATVQCCSVGVLQSVELSGCIL